MRLSDCEITHRHVRGRNLIIIFGERALDENELAALMQEYGEAYGPGVMKPVYASPDGWQTGANEQLGPLASRFVFDEAAEVVLVDGIKFTAEVFLAMSTPTPEGFWFRIIGADETVTVERRYVDELQRPPAAAAAIAETPAPPPAEAPPPAPASEAPVAALADGGGTKAAAPAGKKRSN